MSAIFGIFHRLDAPIQLSWLERMRNAMSHWGRDGVDLWLEGSAGLGQARTFSAPEAQYERFPYYDSAIGVAFTAAARVDNREEALSILTIKEDRKKTATITDSDLLYSAYLKWGTECVKHIYGDWAFAAWHPQERKLVLARDHFGNTALYYYVDSNIFAFASERRALLALDLAPLEMDELYLAQVLTSWTAYHGERTIYKTLHRLPPSHLLTVTPEKIITRQYWRMEDTPLLNYPKRQDYIEPFLEAFDEAVRVRLRAFSPSSPQEVAAPGNEVAATLSGGLDSSSVTATAAQFLRADGRRLSAFTSVPLFDTQKFVGKNFGDELPFAQATAQFAGNVDLYSISTPTLTPIQAIRLVLKSHNEPSHAAGNFFWLYDLESTASSQGARVLLTGQLGNAGVSWTGDVFSQPLAFQLQQKGWRNWTKERLKQLLPSELLKNWRRLRFPGNWERSSAIHPDFAHRLNLLELRLNDLSETPRTSLDKRWQILKPGRSFIGALHAQMGAIHGLEIRDPTGDTRLLTFCLSVPDHVFMDPETGMDRWLIREAMKGRLPDEVRLNRKRGRQAGDLVPRLRASAAEVESALLELKSGPAAEYVDVAYMREIWQIVQSQDSPQAFQKTITILTRGIMAGLWVNEFYNVS